MTAALTCPVCAHVVPPGPSCTRCDWVLSGGPWLDVDAHARRLEFHAELTTARRSFDVAAAVRAAGDDQALLKRVLTHVRGDASAEVKIRPAEHHTEPLAVVGAFAMDLVARHGELAVVDVRLDGVAVARIDVRERHVPVLTGPVRLHAWRDLMPALPQDHDELALVLAGGVGRQQRRAPVELAELALGTSVLVLHRLPDLPIPDEFVSRFADVRLVARSEPVLDAAVVASWVARAPLRHDVSLVLVDVDAQGVTRPVTRTLFSAGTSAGDVPVEKLIVDAPAGGRDPLVLAVVSGPAGTPPRQCEPISVLRCELGPGQPHELEFRLDGPGEITLVRPRGKADEGTALRWPELLDDVPPRYRSDVNALDFAIAVELGGSADTVGARRKLAVDVLAHLAAHHPEPEAVRAAVIGYDDHRLTRAVLKSTRGFVALQDAEDFTAALPASEPIEPKGAPVEDALAVACSLPWRPLPAARRLLVIGGRPPHPPADSRISRCPHRLDWESLVARLDRDQVEHVAVWDRPAWTERPNDEARLATRAWHALASPRRPMLLSGVDAASVVEEAGAVRATAPQPPLLFPLVPKN
ncbi:hypothetical protein JNUCC0626_46750 [Lentzea sp. JNUCC 0626]|uniref:hypothetical protein n=1 Tax=Lentzea sp. JNUCC 0626 TaxID=3367513 RepID=UPI0037485F32